ncbi:superoxide dismutase [Clostridium sp. DJ247]|uniref:superoxide dismutase n=1 Tax=Clostridium sp. DJ247 TaxID=2726188 RepID=UPI001624F9DE|nr:superoxide dismutase [Clostridium sp. DJ247]MBC2582115.1 superoxide dismutase [Clostridium sp. DJ247]
MAKLSPKLSPKEYNFSTVKGITMKQLQEHYKLYNGYVTKINEIWSKPIDAKQYGEGNATYSEMRSLKLGETFALDGVKLHELYFENTTGGFNNPSGDIINLIKRDFNSYENFIEYLKQVGLSMRGWAILSIEPLDNKLHIFGSDAHDVGAVWNAFPLLIMDVYEHAYFLDFGTDRKKYIDVFINNINWKVVNNRLRQYSMIRTVMESIRSKDKLSLVPIWSLPEDI